MKKHIIITKLFDSGGSNAHFKTLLNYWGNENVILILENREQLDHFNKIAQQGVFKIKIWPNLHGYASLRYRYTTNIREVFLILKSTMLIWSLSVRYGFTGITISAVEPEKHLYLFWLPLIKVVYILHSEPHAAMTDFSVLTCNIRLGSKKKNGHGIQLHETFNNRSMENQGYKNKIYPGDL